MDLLNKTDSELQTYAADVLHDLITASNNKDWASFSAPFVNDGKSEEAEEDVKNQWETIPVLSAFTHDVEFLSVLRRSDHIVTLWKMKNTLTTDDILGLLAFTEVEGEIKVSGYRVK